MLRLSKIGVSIWFSNNFKALVKSFVLCMPACRVNSFSNSWFLVSSQAVIASQLCKRRNHASRRMTDLTVHCKAHRPNQRALSKPVPALHFSSTHENQMTMSSLSKSQKRISQSQPNSYPRPNSKCHDPEIISLPFRLSASVNASFLPWQNCLKIILLRSISVHQSVKQPR